jgi:hypothetical protein
MQEFADRRAKIAQRSPQLWMALLNVYPTLVEVNYFLRRFCTQNRAAAASCRAMLMI